MTTSISFELTPFLIFVTLVLLSFVVVRYFLEQIQLPNLNKKTVLISGCDTGFGFWLTLKLLNEGISVFAGCLTFQGEERLYVSSDGMPGKLETVYLDVASEMCVDRALRIVTKKLKSKELWALVNNAGVSGIRAPDDFLEVQDYQDCLNVNTLGAIRLTQAFKPLIKKSQGRIVFVTGICGRVVQPLSAPYSLSKYALEAYADAQRHELSPFKVSVHILEPGNFATPMNNFGTAGPHVQSLERAWNRARSQLHDEYGFEYEKAVKLAMAEVQNQFYTLRIDFVVEAYFHALTSKFPRRRYWVGWDAILIFIPLSCLPTTLQDILIRLQAYLFKFPIPKRSAKGSRENANFYSKYDIFM